MSRSGTLEPKRNIARELNRRGCDVTILPAHTTAAEILALKPDGLMLSNGPGDPAENTDIIRELNLLCETKLPIFGICLGHQLLALARGGETMKLKYGHRGANQPVQEMASKRVYITSQNHGYAVKTDRLPKHSRVSFTNLNERHLRGHGIPRYPRVFGAVSSRGVRGAARHAVSLRSVYRVDGSRARLNERAGCKAFFDRRSSLCHWIKTSGT